MSATALVISALFAAGLDPRAAWSDRAGWDVVKPVALAGIGGSAVEPCHVRVRWNERWLFVDFVCRDTAVVSPGKRDGLDHFLIGDVVEVFLGRAGHESYAEFHATPEGRKTSYFFGDYRKAAAAPRGADKVHVRAERIDGGWRALLSIPWEIAGGDASSGPWEILAARYDYAAPGGTPVLSSFPAQTGKPDFHARDRFARLELRK